MLQLGPGIFRPRSPLGGTCSQSRVTPCGTFCSTAGLARWSSPSKILSVVTTPASLTGLEGCLQISWIEQRGMLWDFFFQGVWLSMAHWFPPSAFVAKLNKNDLPSCKGVELPIVMEMGL